MQVKRLIDDSEDTAEVGDQELFRTWVKEQARQTIALVQVWDFDGQLLQWDEGAWIWKILVRVVQMLHYLESRMDREGR